MTRYMSPWIFTTKKCNLNCGYCYVKQCNIDMDEVIYNKINDTFLNMIKDDKVDKVIYRLAGGEPLLTFDKWKNPIQSFINKAGDNGFVSLITNMTILTEEMIQFFIKNNFGFGISLDGFGFSKPFHSGVSSAEIVMNNIDKLIAARGNKYLDISTVIDAQSFESADKLAHWIAQRDLNWGIYLDHFFCGEIDSGVIMKKMVEIVDILNSYGYDILNKLKFNNIKVNSQYEGCTAGEKLITVGVEGNIYPCQTNIDDTPICNIMDDVDIIDELKKQKKYKLGYNFTLPTACEGCAISDICGGGCKMNNKEINKNYTCDIMKFVIFYMMKKIIDRKEEKNA